MRHVWRLEFIARCSCNYAYTLSLGLIRSMIFVVKQPEICAEGSSDLAFLAALDSRVDLGVVGWTPTHSLDSPEMLIGRYSHLRTKCRSGHPITAFVLPDVAAQYS